MMASNFVHVGHDILKLDNIQTINHSRLISETIEVTLIDGSVVEVTGFAALELIWLIKPSVLEGNPDIKWKKHMWAFHNLFAHPVMQLLAWCKLYKRAIWLHDITVPKPIGYKNDNP